MNEVHGPGLVVADCCTAILPQLGLHSPFRCLVPELQADFLVKTVDPLRVHQPTFTPQQHMNAPVAIAHPRLGQSP